MTPEKKVQNAIIKYLQQLQQNNLPCYYERRQAGGFSYKKGLADLYMVYNGIHVEIEVKQEDGEMSSLQEKRQEICNRLNIIYICVDSLDEFRSFMNCYFNISAL